MKYPRGGCRRSQSITPYCCYVVASGWLHFFLLKQCLLLQCWSRVGVAAAAAVAAAAGMWPCAAKCLRTSAGRRCQGVPCILGKLKLMLMQEAIYSASHKPILQRSHHLVFTVPNSMCPGHGMCGMGASVLCRSVRLCVPQHGRPRASGWRLCLC
jgi:hypothetical protein